MPLIAIGWLALLSLGLISIVTQKPSKTYQIEVDRNSGRSNCVCEEK